MLTTESERRALFSVGAQFWINGVVYASIVPRLPEIREQIGASKSTLGLALTLASIGGLVSSAGSSSMIRRFGSRTVILVGTLVMLFSLPAVSLTTSVLGLALVLGLIAFTDVAVDISMNLQGSWLSGRREVPVMNRLHGLWSLGSVVGGVAATQATASQVNLGLHLGAVAAILIIFEVVVGFNLLGSHQYPSDQRLGSGTGASDSGSLGSGSLDSGSLGSGSLVRESSSADGLSGTSGSVGNRVAIVLALLGAAAIAMEMITTDWASFRLGDDLSVVSGRVGLGFVAFTTGMVTGRFAGDAIEARMGTRELVRFAAILAGSGIMIAHLIPAEWFGPTTDLAVSLMGYFVAALGVSVIFPQLYDAAAKAPGRPGLALGAMTAGSRLATLILPVLVGVLADSRLTVGTAVALVTLPGCLLIFGLRTDSAVGHPS